MIHHTFWWTFWNTYWPYGFIIAWGALLTYAAVSKRPKP